MFQENYKESYEETKRKTKELMDHFGITSECGIDLPIGWIPMLWDLLRDLREAGWNGTEVAQAKVKFDYLRVYIDFLNVEQQKILAAYEEKSIDYCGCGKKAIGYVETPRGRAFNTNCFACDKAYKDWYKTRKTRKNTNE